MANPVREKAVEGLHVGDTITFQRCFSQADVQAFGDLTRDYNPVHYEPRWTAAKGFDGLICHGLLIGSMVCEIGGQIGWLATGMHFQFIRPVYLGDRIECTLTITQLDADGHAEAEAVFSKTDGPQVGLAHLSGRVPVQKDRKLLQTFLDEGDPLNKLANAPRGRYRWSRKK